MDPRLPGGKSMLILILYQDKVSRDSIESILSLDTVVHTVVQRRGIRGFHPSRKPGTDLDSDFWVSTSGRHYVLDLLT